MSVEQVNVVDIISIDQETGEVVLTISDHLDWTDSRAHQLMLQRKFNAYLAFVESGEILQSYENAKDRKVVFCVVFKFRPDKDSSEFLTRARKVIESAGISLRLEVFAESFDN